MYQSCRGKVTAWGMLPDYRLALRRPRRRGDEYGRRRRSKCGAECRLVDCSMSKAVRSGLLRAALRTGSKVPEKVSKEHIDRSPKQTSLVVVSNQSGAVVLALDTLDDVILKERMKKSVNIKSKDSIGWPGRAGQCRKKGRVSPRQPQRTRKTAQNRKKVEAVPTVVNHRHGEV